MYYVIRTREPAPDVVLIVDTSTNDTLSRILKYEELLPLPSQPYIIICTNIVVVIVNYFGMEALISIDYHFHCRLT